ncbi:MAG: AAC(3) family N-acetyltransferase [Bacteroidota bacterium]
MTKPTKESILQDLRAIGINKGDLIFVTADLQKTLYFNTSKSQTLSDWLDIFKELLGEEGSLIVSSYTKTFFRFRKNKDIIFSRNAISNSGALANVLIKQESSVRSTHPTNSYIGFGKRAKEILDNHTPESFSYTTFGDIINGNGKFLMLGTVDENNAPQVVHYAQEVLGYTFHSPYKGLFQTYYHEPNGALSLYTRKDFGGCSRGGRHLYGYLLAENAINIQNVGAATSALMHGETAYNIIKSTLMKKKNLMQCDDVSCIDCYGSLFYNGVGVVPFYIKNFISILRKSLLNK